LLGVICAIREKGHNVMQIARSTSVNLECPQCCIWQWIDAVYWYRKPLFCTQLTNKHFLFKLYSASFHFLD